SPSISQQAAAAKPIRAAVFFFKMCVVFLLHTLIITAGPFYILARVEIALQLEIGMLSPGELPVPLSFQIPVKPNVKTPANYLGSRTTGYLVREIETNFGDSIGVNLKGLSKPSLESRDFFCFIPSSPNPGRSLLTYYSHQVQSHGFLTLKIYQSALSEIKWVWASPGGILCFVLNTGTRLTPRLTYIGLQTNQNFSSACSDDLAIVQARKKFLKLHPRQNQQSFWRLLRDSSLAEVNCYLVDLHRAFQQVELPHKSRQYWWHSVLTRQPEAFDHLVVAFNLRKKPDLEEQFACLAFFHQYPKLHDASDAISTARVVNALRSATPEAGFIPMELSLVNHSPQALALIEDGFTSEYLQSEKIVTPILARLSNLGPCKIFRTVCLNNWTHYDWEKPPSNGAASSHLCGAICLRPPNSRRYPRRSSAADQMLPNNFTNLQQYYCQTLVAIFRVIAHFFCAQSPSKPEAERLAKWNTYIKFDSTKRFAYDVQAEMNKLAEGSLHDSHEALLAAVKHMRKSTGFIQNPDLKVVLALDKARALLDKADPPHQLLFYHGIRSALHTIPAKHNFFATFSDTTSNVADFGYPAQSNLDQILENKSFELFAQIYQINTIDSMVPTSPPGTWEDLESPNRLFSYGPPFFGQWIWGAQQNQTLKSKAASNLTEIAPQALLCFSIPPQSQNPSRS
ncbi:hypothetical protein MJO29_011455, partial [Puccinia striiformis f. sp. tritici]